MKLPEEYEKNMQNILKNQYEKYIESFSKNAKKGFRINKNYIKHSDFDKIFTFEHKNIENLEGYCFLLSNEKIGNSVFHQSGMIYIQEPSSMLAALCLEVKDGEKILDMCSAPGGKASQILENNQSGVVVLNEVVRSRANILFSNIERQGFKNSIITSLEPEKLSENFLNYFDKILVDAPCSGEGMFRKEPNTILEWNAGLKEFNHRRQMQILECADKMLKENGVLVYSTCTFNFEENEKTIYEFCKKFGYEISPTPQNVQEKTTSGFEYIDSKTSLARRCFPFDDFGEGQFMAKLIKTSKSLEEKPSKKDYQKPSANELKIAKKFIEDTIGGREFNYYKLGNNIYISEQKLPYINSGVVSLGVCLGTIEKNILKPFHQFFKAYGREFKNKINLSINSPEVKTYLSGNVIDSQGLGNGYIAVLCENVPLGGGKVSTGQVKNHYPKGLR